MADFYLNGEPIDKLPPEALKIMSENLSRVVSRYFSNHLDEYERYLNSKKRKEKEKPVQQKV